MPSKLTAWICDARCKYPLFPLEYDLSTPKLLLQIPPLGMYIHHLNVSCVGSGIMGYLGNKVNLAYMHEQKEVHMCNHSHEY